MLCSAVLVSAAQKKNRPFTHICALPSGFLSCPGQRRASGVFSPDIYSTHSTECTQSVSSSQLHPLPPGYPYIWPCLVAQTIENLPARQETWVPSLSREDPLEKGTATHSSILRASLVVFSLPLSLSLLCK